MTMARLPRSRCTSRSGASLIEVIVAIGLLAIFASTLFVIIGSQLLSSTGAHQSLIALSLAREGLEAARTIRDTDWPSLATGTHGLAYANNVWSFVSASDTSDGYRRSVTVTELSATERQIVSTVTWLGTAQQTRTVSLATNLSNWRNVASTSPPRLSGDWSNPQTLGTIDLGAGISATGISVRNKLVYMTGTASQSSKSDFFVIDALDGTHPSLVANINIGPGSNALAISGNFAYVANDDSSNQLSIINISATSSPTNIKNFTLSGNNEEAQSIAATGTIVLIGTENDPSTELYLVDVSSPSSPLIKSSLEIGGSVNRIVILGNRAFLATSSSTKEFMVVDISNPNAPVITATVNLPGSNAAIGLYVNSQDDRTYITRESAAGTSPEINVYDVTAPDAPILLGSKEFSNDIPAVFAADTLMFLGTAVSNLEFQIFTATDPMALAYYAGLNFPQVANDIAFESNILYIAVRSNDALRIVTSQ